MSSPTAGFFDPYRAFYETPRKPRDPGQVLEKLNRRHRILIEPNAAIFEGRRVLDLASHDGRWSFAVLRAGAASVVGVEPRQALVDTAGRNFEAYGVDPESYRFVVGDAFDVLARERFEVDVVLCLGFLYHTTRHVELLTRMTAIDTARTFVIDTTVCPAEGNVVELHLEDVIGAGKAFADDSTVGDAQVVGWPSRGAVELMLRHFGLTIDRATEYDQRHFRRLAVVASRR